MKTWRKTLTGMLAAASMIFSMGLACASSQEVTLQGDHSKLDAVVQRPDGQTKAPLVIIMHGFGSNKDFSLLTKLADDLEKDGIATLRFDFNGHGKSGGRFQDMTVPNEIQDARNVYAYAKTLPWVTSISFAGHSQGGVVASMYAGELGTDKVKALALIASAPVLREDALRGNTVGATYDPLNPPETVTMPDGKTKLGRNYIKTIQTLPIYEASAQYQGPVYLIHGTGDTIVPYTYSYLYQRIYFNGQVKLMPGDDHFFTKDQDETAKLVADYFNKELKD